MKTLWMILAGVGGMIAAAFMFRGDFEKAFVAATAAAVCWILNYRQQLRENLASQDEENQKDEDEEVRS